MAQRAAGTVLGVMEWLKKLFFLESTLTSYPLRPPCHYSICSIHCSLLELNQAFCSSGLSVRFFPSPIKSNLTEDSFYLNADQVLP